MPITVEQIDLWRESPSETQVLEFKEAKNQYDNNKLFEYCVAIANEGGGYLLLGISNRRPRIIVGTRAFDNVIGIAEKIFIAVGFRVDVEEIFHPEGRVVAFQIPSRLRGSAYALDGKFLMRAGEALVPMSEDRLRTIFKEGEPDWLEQHSVTGVTGEDVISLLDVETFFELRATPFPDRQPAIIDRLVQDRLIDRIGSRYSIRRIGAVLLANNLSDFTDLSRKAPRVVVYKGSSKMETTLDQTGTKGYAVGFQRLVAFIVKRLPQNEVIEDALRTTRLIPEISIRELAANALIHQDFSVGGTSAMFEIYDNRVEFSNPGVPMFPVERFIDAHQSRNERLADATRRLRVCEEKGSGIDRVVQMAEFYQLPAPEFRVGQHTTIATIFSPRPFEEMDRNDRIRACYQHCAIRYITNQRMTNQSLRERFRLSENKSPTISQIIAQTMDAGFIKPDENATGSKKFARYTPFWG